MLLVRGFRELAWIVTGFTVGHSITLIFATFQEITANYYLVDAVIALTDTSSGDSSVEFMSYKLFGQ